MHVGAISCLLRWMRRFGGKMEALLEEREEVAALEKEDAYVRGTRMGAKMAVALLKGE